MKTKMKIPRQKKCFGTCRVGRLSPPLAPGRSLNIAIAFEEALKFNLAVDEAVRALNRNDRSTQAGRDEALHITVFDHGQITVHRLGGRLKAKTKTVHNLARIFYPRKQA